MEPAITIFFGSIDRLEELEEDEEIIGYNKEITDYVNDVGKLEYGRKQELKEAY